MDEEHGDVCGPHSVLVHVELEAHDDKSVESDGHDVKGRTLDSGVGRRQHRIMGDAQEAEETNDPCPQKGKRVDDVEHEDANQTLSLQSHKERMNLDARESGEDDVSRGRKTEADVNGGGDELRSSVEDLEGFQIRRRLLTFSLLLLILFICTLADGSGAHAEVASEQVSSIVETHHNSPAADGLNNPARGRAAVILSLTLKDCKGKRQDGKGAKGENQSMPLVFLPDNNSTGDTMLGNMENKRGDGKKEVNHATGNIQPSTSQMHGTSCRPESQSVEHVADTENAKGLVDMTNDDILCATQLQFEGIFSCKQLLLQMIPVQHGY